MAILDQLPNFYFTASNRMGSLAKKTGQIILSIDENKLYIDSSTTTRISVSDIVHVESSSLLPIAPLNKFYIADSEAKVYISINSNWVELASAEDNTTLIYGGTSYKGEINVGQGLAIDASGGTTTLQSVQSTTVMEFTSSSLVDGILTLTNQVVGTITIVDNTGTVVLPGMQQSGNNVLVDLSAFEVTGTWKVYYSHGGSPSAADLTNILLNLTW